MTQLCGYFMRPKAAKPAGDVPSTLSRRAERPTTAVSTPLTSLPQAKISHISHLTSTKVSVPKHPIKVNPAVHWSAPR